MATQQMSPAGPAAAGSTPSAQVVGNAFVHQYYHILHQSPEFVYRFYLEGSKVGRLDSQGGMNSVTGMEAINEKILSLDYSEIRAEIKTIDAQESLEGGVIVLVTGFLTGKDDVRRNFTQSFFLATQDKGYYVFNDIFRYVEDSDPLTAIQVPAITPEQETPPPQEQQIYEISVPELEEDDDEVDEEDDEVIDEEMFNPSDHEEALDEDEEIPVEEEIDEVEVPNSSPPLPPVKVEPNLLAAILEEQPEKLYASILPSIQMPKHKKSSSQGSDRGEGSNCGAVRDKMQQDKTECKLSDDNLIEILSRVPGSSLSRSRFVCKKWFSLITTNSYLAKLHVDRGFKSDRPRIIVFSYQDDHLSLMDDEGGHGHIVLHLGPLYSRISPSCNGLICLHGRNNHVGLFNPTTRQKIVLPKPTVGFNGTSSLCFIGYIPTTKQYKVLRFFNSCKYQNSCEVLTIGTNTWRQITSVEFCWNKKITTVNFGEPKGKHGVSLNGSVFCIARCLESDNSKGFGIISFDFKEEKFGTVQFPMLLTDLDSLSVLEGQLCVAVLRSGCQSMRIWRMEDITSHTWVQIYTVGISPVSLMFCHLQPILIHQGKILIKSTEGLHYRNLKTGSKIKFIYQEVRMHDSQVHIESLVNLEHL